MEEGIAVKKASKERLGLWAAHMLEIVQAFQVFQEGENQKPKKGPNKADIHSSSQQSHTGADDQGSSQQPCTATDDQGSSQRVATDSDDDDVHGQPKWMTHNMQNLQDLRCYFTEVGCCCTAVCILPAVAAVRVLQVRCKNKRISTCDRLIQQLC